MPKECLHELRQTEKTVSKQMNQVTVRCELDEVLNRWPWSRLGRNQVVRWSILQTRGSSSECSCIESSRASCKSHVMSQCKRRGNRDVADSIGLGEQAKV